MTGSDLHQCVQGGSIMILYRSFFQRFGHLGVCVLPAEALSNDLLQVDPQTHIMPPSLRQSVSVLGLCFARVLRSCADGLYWADVAATPDLVDAQRVLLTEEQLYHTLPWDIRLVQKQPGDIRNLLIDHAQEVQPVQQQVADQVHILTPFRLFHSNHLKRLRLWSQFANCKRRLTLIPRRGLDSTI